MLVAVDPSTKYMTLVWFSRNGGWLDYEAVGQNVKAQYAEQRVTGIWDALKAKLRDLQMAAVDDSIQVWCEAVAYVGDKRSLAQMAACINTVQLACHDLGIPFYTLGNNVWKKEIIGNGMANKEQIKEFLVLQKFLPDDLTPPDVYDAYGIGLAALRRTAAPPEEGPAPEKRRPNRRPPK